MVVTCREVVVVAVEEVGVPWTRQTRGVVVGWWWWLRRLWSLHVGQTRSRRREGGGRGRGCDMFVSLEGWWEVVLVGPHHHITLRSGLERGRCWWWCRWCHVTLPVVFGCAREGGAGARFKAQWWWWLGRVGVVVWQWW